MINVSINPKGLEAIGNILPIDGLSAKVRGIVNDVVGAYQCNRDMVVASLFAVAGTAVGKRLVIDDGKYKNYMCLWICNVAPSGSNKSEPMRFLLRPLKDRDAYNYKRYREELKLYKAAGDSNSDKPIFKQYILSDSTPESRNQVLSANADGVILFRDEIRGLIDDFGRYNKSGELSQLLSVFDSDNIVINRKSDDTLLIESPFMSILGSIQPSVLPDTFGNDLMMGNGFNQRWLFCFPEDTPPAMYDDGTTPSYAANRWMEVIGNIFIYDFNVDGGKLYLRGEAKKVYIQYYNRLQLLKAEADAYMGSTYSKLQIQAIRWAGIAHILGGNPYTVDITPEEMDYSCRCMDYFQYCAEKVYGILRAGKNRPEARPMGKEQMIANVYHLTNPVSQSAVANALGVTQQFISKCLKKYPKLSGCRLYDGEYIDNKEDINEIDTTT